MDAPFPAARVRSTVVALLLAAAVLGAADALIALWHSAGVAPARTVPLCLTAPFPIALVVLAPPAIVSLLHDLCTGRRLPVRSRAGLLVGVAGGLAALHAAAAARFVSSVGPGMGGILSACLALTVAAWIGFASGRRCAIAWLAGVSNARLAWLVRGAIVLHLGALGGVAWQWCREGRGLERALLDVVRDAWSSEGLRSAAQTDGADAQLVSRPANLVLVTIDTLRADHLDDAHMPRTSALAHDGARFTRAFASSSWTLPSVASLLTGLPAARHGAGAPRGTDLLSRAPLAASHATLATVLRRSGFVTRAVVTNPYLGIGYGLGQGFEVYENVSLESEAVITLTPTVGFATLSRLVLPLVIADRGDSVTSRAARFLRVRHEGRFFLWLHYLDAHAPYDGATRSFRDELLAGGGVTTRLPRMAQLRAGEIRPDVATRALLRTAYADAVRFVDGQIGKIVELLDENGLADRTIVVVTADHGEELWDRGGVEHGHTLYDELVRVPLVIRCPGCAARGARIDAPVATAALAPTLLELLGVDAGTDAGASALRAERGFVPLLRGEPWRPPAIVSENLLFAEERVALRTSQYTYVAWPNGKEELYDRARDPREMHDIAARGALLRRHRRLLGAARAEPDVVPPTVASTDGSVAETAGDTRLRRALGALGYVW